VSRVPSTLVSFFTNNNYSLLGKLQLLATQKILDYRDELKKKQKSGRYRHRKTLESFFDTADDEDIEDDEGIEDGSNTTTTGPGKHSISRV
jgi:hypothetical protein